MNTESYTILTIGIIITAIIFCLLIKLIDYKKIQKTFLEPKQDYDNRSTEEIYYETATKQRRYTNVILTLILFVLVIIAIPAYFQIIAILENIYY